MERKKILITDDVELFLMLERTVYNRSEFGLIIARSGFDFLKIVKKERPDLIFVNEDLPDINGRECCKIIKNDYEIKEIPVVLVVHTTMGTEDIDYRKFCCDDVLFKPIEKQELLALTRKYINVIERGNDRVKARLMIKYCVDAEQNYSYSIDLNSGGVFLETERPLEVGTNFELEFELPDSNSIIRCDAKGAWINDPIMRKKAELPAGMGVQFVNLSAIDRKAIDDFVNERKIYH
jgi:uncharacterized protein (TIGR02266 family)